MSYRGRDWPTIFSSGTDLTLAVPVVVLMLFPPQRDVEPLASDELVIRHLPERIGRQGDHSLAHRELLDRDAEAVGRHLQEDAAGFGGDPAHRPAIGLDGVRAPGAALVDGGVGAAP